MANDEENWRLVVARQFSIGTEKDQVTMKFDYKNLPKDTNEFQLGLSVPFAIARELAREILAAADKAEASSR